MATAIELVENPNLDIDPVTATTAANKKGYSWDELVHFRIGHDDIRKLVIQIYNFGEKGQRVKKDLRPFVTDAVFEDSIDATPTFTLTVHDPDWELLNSGALDHNIDIRPGPVRWYRISSFSVVDDEITLGFETRNAVFLTQHKRPHKANRQKVTRAQFIKSLVNEVKDVRIKFFCPELTKRQKIYPTQFGSSNERKRGRAKGFTESDKITVKHRPATASQRAVVERAIAAGFDRHAPGLVIVAAVMTVIQESTASNYPQPPNPPYVGAFQQNRKMGWPATANTYKDANGFYDHAIPLFKRNPNIDLGFFVATVQGVVGSTNPLNSGYAQSANRWRDEAQHAVNAFGGIEVGDPGSPENLNYKKKYEFMVGEPDGPRRENYLGAIYRLAEEVNWRAFWVRDNLHYQSEEDLFKSKARKRLRRYEDGVESVSFNWDRGQKFNEMTLRARMERWAAPIGAVVIFDEGGPAQGRWLVTNIRRSVFDELGDITLRKPMREKLEPANEPGTREPNISPGRGVKGNVDNAIPGSPVPGLRPHAATHETAGLPGYPAYDYMAPAGTPVVAPVHSKVFKLSGRAVSVSTCPPGGPCGYSIYLRALTGGTQYYLTHLDHVNVKVGDVVAQGDQIAEIANGPPSWSSPHVHMGIHRVRTGGGPYGTGLLGP